MVIGDSRPETRDLKCVFRGFYADGVALGKFDVGIARAVPDLALNAGTETAALARTMLELPAIVPLDSTKQTPLGQAGSRLARAYLRASSASKPETAPLDAWVRAGSPILTIQHNARDRLVLPKDAIRVDAPEGGGGVDIRHASFSIGGFRRRVWLLGYHTVEDYALARQLRIDLVRLHCERETLRLVLTMVATKAIDPEPRSEASDALQRYLQDAIERVLKLGRDRQSLVARLVGSTQDDRALSEVEALGTELKLQLERLDVRGNVLRKATAYVATGALVRADGEVDAEQISITILRGYSHQDFVELCAELDVILTAHGHPEPLNLDTLGGEDLRDRVHRLVIYLTKRGEMRSLLDIVRRRYPDTF